MNVVKDDLPDHFMSLLGQVLDAFRKELVRSGAWPLGLRSSQLRLLSMTPVEGMRVTDLAERVGMTKQSLGEFANDLEHRGLLESARDPSDGRVRLLRPTARGLEAVSASESTINMLEMEWKARLGAQQWDQLRLLLREAVSTASATNPNQGAKAERRASGECE